MKVVYEKLCGKGRRRYRFPHFVDWSTGIPAKKAPRLQNFILNPTHNLALETSTGLVVSLPIACKIPVHGGWAGEEGFQGMKVTKKQK